MLDIITLEIKSRWLTACASPAPRSAAERRQAQAQVGRHFDATLEPHLTNQTAFD